MNSIEETALKEINQVHDRVEQLENKAQRMRGILEDKGFELKFDYYVDSLDSMNDVIACRAIDKLNENCAMVFKAEAIVADEDNYIPELGRYLAISRVFEEVMKSPEDF